MTAYFLRRLLLLAPTLLVISFLIYLGLELTPGDAVSYMIPIEAMRDMTPEALNKMREALGLNDPFSYTLFQMVN